MTIGREQFTLKEGAYTPQTFYWTLNGAYEKPSRSKIAIWEHWKSWFSKNSENKYDYITIRSRNCFMFTINGRITVEGISYTFLITKTRNEIYAG